MAVLDRKANRVSDDGKIAVGAGKRIVAHLSTGDNGLHKIDEDIRVMTQIRNVIRQDGDGKGKRFSGAKDTTIEENASALQRILRDGNNPLANVSADATA